MKNKECELRETHKIIRCDIGNCETCKRVFGWTKQVEKETAKEIIKMFYEYDTKQDLKNAIAERYGLEGETWR